MSTYQEDGSNLSLEPGSVYGEPRKKSRCGCCFVLAVIPVLFAAAVMVWITLNAQDRTNILVLGIDSREDTNLGRSDTMILATFVPSEPFFGMLSIPRDLWVNIPGYGPNRINTAHFFAEAELPDSGPAAAMETVRTNFGVDVHYYIRLHLIGFLDFIDALGGIEISIPRPMSGYEAGMHQMNGEQALAFVRDRAGSDDFFRMERGQIFLKAVVKKMLSPSSWLALPATWEIISQNVDTDIPVRLFPYFAYTLLRVGPDGINSRIIDRSMVNPFLSEGGANVLAPRWETINPVLMELFGQ